MTDETRLTGWYNLLKDMMEVAGSSEWSSLLPSAEVADAAPADLPAEYIRIVGRAGTYEPALKIPGATYNTGDKVIVLYVRGTEAIALTQAPASSGSIGKGWKLGNLLVVSNSGQGDYVTLATAVAAAVAGDTILIDTGTYVCEGITLPAGVNLIGIDRDGTILSSTTATTALTPGAGSYIANLTFTVVGSHPNSVGIDLTNLSAVLEDVTINQSGGGSGIGTYCSNSTSKFINCFLHPLWQQRSLP